MSALARLVAALVVLACATHAKAQCPEATAAWASRCDGAEASIVSCPEGHVIVSVRGGLRVDVAPSSERAFITVGSLGLSPIGRFESWQQVPAERRAGFDALVRCVRADSGPLRAGIERVPMTHEARPRPPRTEVPVVPWRLALALALLALLALRRGRAVVRGAIVVVLTSGATFVLRALVVPESYFHQNGQGPFWVSLALGEPSGYGPGYAELFQAAARAVSDDPERGLWIAQAVLASMVPVLVAMLVRATTERTWLAVACGLAVALSPTLARLAQSESYLATCGALIVIAAAVLATYGRADARARERVVASIAAGLMLAQAARVHPVCWLPCALVPLVVLVGRGEAKERLRATAMVALLALLTVFVVSGPALFEVLEGSLGAHWRGELSARESRWSMPPSWVILCVVVGLSSLAIAVSSKVWRRLVIATSVLALTVLVAWGANLLDPTVRGVHAAYASLHLAPAMAALAAMIDEAARRWRRPDERIAATAVLALALTIHALTAKDALELSTDAREALLVRAWRSRIPRDAAVLHLARAGQHVMSIPIYDERAVPITVGEPIPRVQSHYLRTSLCSTAAGRAACEALEREARLVPLETATLPAIPSVGNLPYDRDAVDLALHRVGP